MIAQFRGAVCESSFRDVMPRLLRQALATEKFSKIKEWSRYGRQFLDKSRDKEYKPNPLALRARTRAGDPAGGSELRCPRAGFRRLCARAVSDINLPAQ